ncbi:MAG: acyl-ACP--UDP-N-acetylglucosamine O-acyltransferase [bacterium]|nr:acyl-ACP--UDP-N-acetylglucosamine O-acyltransferase [Candidatus Sumerlaeota bacterium]
MTSIHPSAIIDPAAEIDSSAIIGPYVIIEGQARIGARTRIMAHSHIVGRAIIGDDNEIYTGAAIGHPPQHLGYKGEETGVVIGNRNVFREYVTIHRAYEEGHNTTIGDHNFLMSCSHVGHDAVMGSRIVMANCALLGGHTTVGDGAVLSGNVAVHQFVRIGRLAMIGGVTRVIQDVPPFMMVVGHSEIHGLNVVGMRRAGFSPQTRRHIKHAYKLLYRSGFNVQNSLKAIEAEIGDACPEVTSMVEFIRASTRGICHPGKSGDGGE